MIILLASLLPGTFYSPLQAQTSERDSLRNLLARTNQDSTKVELLRQIGYTLEETDKAQARENYISGLRLSRQTQSPFLEAGCLIDIGDLEQLNGQYDSAESYFRLALDIGKRINSKLRTGSAYLNLGNSYLYRNQADKAIENYMLSEVDLLKINDTKRLSALYANVEAVFYDQHNYAKSLEYGMKAIDLAKTAGNPGVAASAYLNASNTLNKLGEKQRSINFLYQSLSYARQATEISHLQDAYQNLGDRYMDNGQYEKAANSADSSLYYARKIGTPEVLSYALNLSGNAALKRNDKKKARVNLLESNKYSQQYGNWVMLRENYSSLAELEAGVGNFAQAYEDEKAATALKDSSFNELINRQITEIEVKYQTKRKQEQITALQATKQLQALALREKSLINIALLIGIFAFVIITILIFVAIRRKQTLAAQNATLQTQRIRELEQEKQLVAMGAILKGQEDERTRIARDLHDGLGGMLSSVKVALYGLQGSQASDYPAEPRISRTVHLLDDSISELRRIARNLMPEALLRFGLKDALSDFIHSINESSTGLQIRFQAFGLEERLPPGVEIVVFRIVQELVNNILKHAHATEAHIQLIRDGNRLSTTVEDNGRGFAISTSSSGSGMGNIRSRVEYLNGRIDIQSKQGSGTFIHIEIEKLPS